MHTRYPPAHTLLLHKHVRNLAATELDSIDTVTGHMVGQLQHVDYPHEKAVELGELTGRRWQKQEARRSTGAPAGSDRNCLSPGAGRNTASRYCSSAAGRSGRRYTPPVRCAACAGSKAKVVMGHAAELSGDGEMSCGEIGAADLLQEGRVPGAQHTGVHHHAAVLRRERSVHGRLHGAPQGLRSGGSCQIM